MTWRFADPEHTIASRDLPNGGSESCLATAIAGETIAPYVPPPPTVPAVVSPLQARRALDAAGLRAAVETAIAAADATTRDAWEWGLEVRRDSPLIAAMSAALGICAADVDALFMSAAQITDQAVSAAPVATITSAQLFKGLALHGVLATPDVLAALSAGVLPPAIEAIVVAMPDDMQAAARAALAYGGAMARDSGIFAVVCQGLGIDDPDRDGLWAVAITIENGGAS